MGKGDKRTKRGKIVLGTYGKRRPKKSTAPVVKTEVKEVKKVKEVKAETKEVKEVKEEK